MPFAGDSCLCHISLCACALLFSMFVNVGIWKFPNTIFHVMLLSTNVFAMLSGKAFDADNGGRSFAENAKVNESLLLMKFYSSSGSVLSQLLSCSDGSELNVTFEVSDHEREVILNQRSTFILGRSGTGKLLFW